MKNVFSILINAVKKCSPLGIGFLINAMSVVYIDFVPYSILILFLIWLHEIVKRKIYFSKRLIKAVLFTMIPFFLSCFGLLFTTNYYHAFEDISRVLPFFFFPFFFLFEYKNKSQIVKAKLMFIVFTITLLVHLIINLHESLINYIEFSCFSSFLYTNYVKGANSVSIFLLFILFGMFKLFKYIRFLRFSFLFWSVYLFFLISLVLLQSRLVIISYFIGMFFLLIMAKKDKYTIYGIFLVSLSLSLFLFPINQSRFKTVKDDVNVVVKSVEENNKSTNNLSIQNEGEVNGTLVDYSSSFHLRFNALTSSLNCIKKNLFFGVGTGDWKDELIEEYKLNNLEYNYIQKTAPHNQYLRTTLKHGLFGALLLFIYLFVYLKKAIRSDSFLAMPFVITLLLTSFGYDVLDVGGLAPFNALFITVIFVPILFCNEKRL